MLFLHLELGVGEVRDLVGLEGDGEKQGEEYYRVEAFRNHVGFLFEINCYS